MNLFISNGCEIALKGKHIFLDNDFLSWFIRSEEALEQIIALLNNGYPMYEQFTKLEFLRDIFDPKLIPIYETFLNSEIFYPDFLRQETLNALLGNSLLLSKIYKHKNTKANASVPDLLLAAKIMYNSQSSVLITGNKKDFPSCIFDIVGLITAEKEDGDLTNFSVLKFNEDKFNKCNEDLKKLEESMKSKIGK